MNKIGDSVMNTSDKLHKCLHDAILEWAETGQGKPFPQIAYEWLEITRDGLLSDHVINEAKAYMLDKWEELDDNRLTRNILGTAWNALDKNTHPGEAADE